MAKAVTTQKLSPADKRSAREAAFVANFIKAIEDSVEQWQPQHDGAALGLNMCRPYNMASGHVYKGYNAIALGLGSQYQDSRWITFDQLKDMRASMARSCGGSNWSSALTMAGGKLPDTKLNTPTSRASSSSVATCPTSPTST